MRGVPQTFDASIFALRQHIDEDRCKILLHYETNQYLLLLNATGSHLDRTSFTS